MPRKGGKRVKTRTHKDDRPAGATVLRDGKQESLDKGDVPRSIVVKSSKVIAQVNQLVRDMRKLMEPNTATSLKEASSNRMKDYCQVATQLHVTHLLTLSQTKSNIILRIGRTPIGPTLHFRVLEYTLCQQVRATQKRPHENLSLYMNPPLVVLNNFGQAGEQHVKLMKVTFQHMFPSINVKTIRLSECRRVVLFHLRKEDGVVEMRHYAITASPVGINRNIKKIINGNLPDLGDLVDVSQFFEGNAVGDGYSDSEAEDETSHVELCDKYVGKGNSKTQKSAMKLAELGPRMSLELFKVEKGICEGEILYHKFKTKTAADAAKTKSKLEREKALKEERKATQAKNVEKKKLDIEEKKANKKRRRGHLMRDEDGGSESEGEDEDDGDDEDDVEGDDDRDDDGDDDEEEEEEGSVAMGFSGDEDDDSGSEVDNEDLLESDEED